MRNNVWLSVVLGVLSMLLAGAVEWGLVLLMLG